VPVAHAGSTAQGERYRDLAIVPPATVRFDDEVYVFPLPAAADKPGAKRDRTPAGAPGGGARGVRVTVEGSDRAISGSLRLALPAGWSSDPAAHAIRFARAGGGDGDSGDARIGPVAAAMSAAFVMEERSGIRGASIEYEHIPHRCCSAGGAKLARGRDVRGA
jgi:hypothetical protein